MADVRLSVLFPVYLGDNEKLVSTSLESIKSQLRVYDELLIIQDGPVKPDVAMVLNASLDDNVRIIRIEENRGLVNALNLGIDASVNEFIMRVDADDICLPDRVRKQVDVLQDHKVDVCSGWVTETGEYVGRQVVKKVPENHAAIMREMLWRNPINHMACVFRKSCALKVGGYPDIKGAEDYGLWIKLMSGGCRFYNIQAPLMIASTNENFLDRRTGGRFYKSEVQLFSLKLKLFPHKRSLVIFATSIRLAVRLLPKSVLRTVYSQLRSKKRSK